MAFTPASWAADLVRVDPPASIKDPLPASSAVWSGFYFGGHLGGAESQANARDHFDYDGDPELYGRIKNSRFLGGGQAGYNVQRGRFVFGVEGDFGYLGLSKNKAARSNPSSCTGTYTTFPYSVTYPAQYCNVDAKYSVSSDAYGDLTARLGYASDRMLFYVKGGVALTSADFTANYAGGNCTFDYSCGGHMNVPSTFRFGHSETLIGWTAGAGMEYALSRSWSLKGEYHHFDFGSMSYSYGGSYLIPGYDHTGGHYTSNIEGKTSISVTADAVTVGLNYHLQD